MADKNIVIQRNNAGVIDNVYPRTQWGNVLNKPTTFTPTAHTHAATDITSGTIATVRLGSGTANTSTFLRGDNTWTTPAGGGDVVGPSSSTTGRVATFNGTTGKLIQDGGVLLSTLSTTSHVHTTSLYGSSPSTVSSGGTLTLTLSANITQKDLLLINWGTTADTYFRTFVRMIRHDSSTFYAVLQETVDAVSSGDLIYKLSCQLGTTTTTGSYTGNQITFRNGMLQSTTGTQTATTLYVQSISRVVF
jgi:hypothetical protein